MTHENGVEELGYKHYFEDLRQRHAKHLGYPYNLRFDRRDLSEALGLLINNLGDPYVASNYASDSREYEQKVVEFFLRLWHFDDEWGYVTSSGTEGNLVGILYGKCYLPGAHLVYSESSHYSVPKAAVAYGLPSIRVRTQPSGEMDYEALREAVRASGAKSLILVANISSTFTGAYDSAEVMIEKSIECGIPRRHLYVHGDGALGGMMLPFLSDVAQRYVINGSNYDSLSASGHKMPGSPIPCGVIVTRRKHMERFAKRIDYLNSVDSTLGGSRSGLAAIFLYEALVARPISYWRDAVTQCVANAKRLTSSLCQAGVAATLNPYSNTVVFPRPSEKIVKEWQLACQGDRAHAVVMPNHTDNMLEEFSLQYCAERVSIA